VPRPRVTKDLYSQYSFSAFLLHGLILLSWMAAYSSAYRMVNPLSSGRRPDSVQRTLRTVLDCAPSRVAVVPVPSCTRTSFSSVETPYFSAARNSSVCDMVALAFAGPVSTWFASQRLVACGEVEPRYLAPRSPHTAGPRHGVDIILS